MAGELAPVWAAIAPTAVAWLFSFAIHSTLLLGLVWLATRCVRSYRLRDVLWKTALVGGILTTTLQFAWGVRPLGGRFEVSSGSASVRVAGQDEVVSWDEPGTGAVVKAPSADGASLSRGEEPTVSPFPPPLPESGAGEQGGGNGFMLLGGYLSSALWDGAGWLFGLWLLGAAVMVLRLCLARYRLCAGLGHRRDITEGPLASVWVRLCRSSSVHHRVRLTSSSFISSPMVLGTNEICLPQQITAKLTPEQQRILLAHELAHVGRGDPTWLVVSGVLGSLFFFQPLYRLARRHMQECAEYLCDDRAARCTGGGVSLARCLVEVVGWPDLHTRPATVASVPRSVGASRGESKGVSSLEYRVRRLLDGSWNTRVEAPRWWWAAIILSVLLIVVGVGPGVSVGINSMAPVVAVVGAEIAGPWKVVHQREIEHSAIMAGFLNEDSGITVGNYGDVYYTADGGNGWFWASSGSADVLALDIVDERVVWHCAYRAARVSTDGGHTWQTVGSYGGAHEPCRSLSFIDTKTGWIATSSQLEATADGGASWTRIPLPKGVKITAIALRTLTEGYLLDPAGMLYVTQDGGASWSARSLGLEEGMMVVPVPSGAAIRFFDTDRGLIVLSLVGGGRSKVLAMRTADGGQTWEQEDVPVEFGVPYLTRDGVWLTMVRYQAALGFPGIVENDITVLRHQRQ